MQTPDLLPFFGRLAEWSIAFVLKTKARDERAVSSNLTPTAKFSWASSINGNAPLLHRGFYGFESRLCPPFSTHVASLRCDRGPNGFPSGFTSRDCGIYGLVAQFWKSASMALKRSSVRSRSGPPFVSEECVVEPYQEGGKSRQRLDTVGRMKVRTKHVTNNGRVA